MKRLDALPSGDGGARRWVIRFAFALLYGGVFLAFFYLGDLFTGTANGSLWYPAAGLRLGLLLVFGWRLTPWLAVPEVLAVALFGALRPETPYSDPIEVLLVVQTPLVYGLAAFALGRFTEFDLRLRRLRDMVWLLSSAIAVPLVAAAESRWVLILLGRMHPSEFVPSTLGFFIGDTIGILMLSPLILVASDHYRLAAASRLGESASDQADDHPEPLDRGRLALDFLLIWVFMIALHQLPNWFDEVISYVKWYVVFLPVTWISFRHGLAGSIAGTLAITSGAAWLSQLPVESLRFHELQILVMLLSITSLLMGSAISSRLAIERTLERQKQTLEAEIVERERAERERKRLIRELEAKNDELERFTYTISHDLKAPLVTIQGFLGRLKKDAAVGDAERLDQDMNRISAAATRMVVLVDELLELSRVGQQAQKLEAVPLLDLAREAVEQVAGEIADRGVEVRIAPDLPVVMGDRTRLAQVLQNLLQNAVKYMGDQESPRVEIGIRSQAASETDRALDTGLVVCFVRDNGMGIEPRHHEKVFELFQRVSTEIEGTGLGLALVNRIIEAHGGRVWIESEGRGAGATFCLTLPRS